LRISTKPHQFSVEDFRVRAAERGQFSEHGEFGDHHLNPDFKELVAKNAFHDAAVLIPVIGETDAPSVLLTRRADSLRTHSGQVAFPGGKIDAEDMDPVAAAIRECEEETGIGASHIDVVGQLPDYMAGSGFRISPVLAVIAPGYRIDPNPDEVDAVFEVPLAFLMDQANHQKGSREFQGRERFYYEMPYDGWYIWGVTAGIIRLMYERLYA
jgi:8-oxo-dGTP pyrophosphatase MutT (NUDIX family)